MYLCWWSLQAGLMAARCKSENLSFWWITITGTTVRVFFSFFDILARDFKFYDFQNQMGERARGVFPLVFSLSTCALRNFACIPTSGLHLRIKVWTLTSKGKSETEAHRDDFTTDRTSSKHLAQTLFWSSVLYSQLVIHSADIGLECGCGTVGAWQQLGTKLAPFLL